LAVWSVALTLLATLGFEAVAFVPVHYMPFYRDGDPIATMTGLRRLSQIHYASAAVMDAGVLVFLFVLRSTQKEKG
jgi:hypothetical protein